MEAEPPEEPEPWVALGTYLVDQLGAQQEAPLARQDTWLHTARLLRGLEAAQEGLAQRLERAALEELEELV